ncbi:hypothetical protein ACFCV3_13320 [Kribbella sp. NPDC056345]|uniref:hypothetical protein n=1 Tax=Kribbella sp. NPDC056345 TaxID=3345789 RepID=UPI0035DF20EC
MSAFDIASRHRRAQLVVCFVYVVVPVFQLVVLLLLRAWTGVAIAVFALLLFGVFWRGNRYDTQYWPAVGGTTCGMTGLFVGLFGTDSLGYAVLAALPGAFVGYWLGRLAVRLVLHPLDARLADSPYQLVFRLRDNRGTRLAIEDTSLRLLVKVKKVEGDRTTHTEEAVEVAFQNLKGAYVRQLSGSEPIVYPIGPEQAGSRGTALVVESFSGEWILPHDDAVVLGQIIDRRIAGLRGTQ